MASTYNTTEVYPVKNLIKITLKELHIHSFTVIGSLVSKYRNEFYATIPGKIAREELKYKEYVLRGLDKVGQGLLDVLTGKNFGKCIVVVADE